MPDSDSFDESAEKRVACKTLESGAAAGKPHLTHCLGWMLKIFVVYTGYEVLTLMQGETGERWRKLCEQATIEQDAQKLMELAHEIDRLLEAKEQRLKERRTNTAGAV